MSVKLHKIATTVGAAIEGGYGLLAELRDECQEAYDNTPDSLQGGERGSALETAVEELENHCDDSPWDGLQNFYLDSPAVYNSNQRKSQSRSDRRDEAVRMLEAGSSVLQGYADALEASIGDEVLKDEDERGVNLAALKQVLEEIEECTGEAENVYFPGRNG